jgi:hypothetical protein
MLYRKTARARAIERCEPPVNVAPIDFIADSFIERILDGNYEAVKLRDRPLWSIARFFHCVREPK